MTIKCRYCNATVQTRKEYSKHLEMHKEYDITCPECGRTFHSLGRFREHKEVHQPKPQCGICNRSFSYTTGLRRHQRQFHRDVKRHKCLDISCNATIWGTIKCLEHPQKHDEHCKQPGN
ncbi:zinc finger protein, partial [Loa loa]